MLALPFRLAAQVPADSAGAPSASTGDTLRAVELDRRDIFDPDERGWIARVGNALHIQTRAATIRRELLFHPGEPYDSARVAESERNLRGLAVFRRVKIDTVRTDSGLVARVLTKDGWSTKADWRFRSTGGEVAYTIGLVEDNLLGTASSAAVRYRKTPDRTSVTLGFRRPRLFAGKVGLAAVYENRSDGRVSGLAVEQPFYSLTSRFGFRVEGEDRDERVLQFFGGSNVARDTITHRYGLARVSAAWAARASSEGYLRWGVLAQVRREDFRPEASTVPFGKTVTGAAGPYLTWSRAHFLVTRGVAGFAREEDVDLGLTVRLGLMVAPKAFGYQRDGIGHRLAGPRRRPGTGRVRVPRGAAQRPVRFGRARQRHGAGRGHGRAPARAAPGGDPAPRERLAYGSSAGDGIRSRTGPGSPRLSEPRLYRRPLLFRHGRVPADHRGRLPRPARSRRGRIRGPRWGVVRG